MSESPPFRGLAETLEKVRGTSSKISKVGALSEYLQGLGPDDAEVAARLATGRAAERGAQDETQVGYSNIIDVLKEVCGATDKAVSEIYLRHGDLGEVAEELLNKKHEQPLFDTPITLKDLKDSFQSLRASKGKGSTATKRGLVKSLLLRASPLEGKYIVKVLTGETRIGLAQGLVEEAISAAYTIRKEDAAQWHMLLGDLGLLARRAAAGETGGIKISIFRPVNFMLAEPMATPAEVAAHFDKEAIAEFKYDGIRAQVHKQGREVRVYSRKLEDVTRFFSEISGEVSNLRGDFILDGEIVPFVGGKPLPFQLLQRRLRRVEGLEEAAKNAPVVYFAFDILLLGKQETYLEPLSARRKALAGLVRGPPILLAQYEMVTGEEQVARAFRKSRDLGYEGLVIKDPGSTYGMGRRGAGWVKLKEELDTIDAVIVAAEYGHGKRAGVISDYTFAVKDGQSLKVIGKAYSGLTDQEIDDMTRKMKETTVKDFGYRRAVRPEVVIEVAFDSIQRSSRHDSGYALRFPRIKRIRSDKSANEIDTLERVTQIFQGQRLKVEEGETR